MLDRLGRAVVRRRWIVLVTGFVILCGAALVGAGAVDRLSSGGYATAGPDLVRTERVLADQFGVDRGDLTFLLRTEPGRSVDDPDVALAGSGFADRLHRLASGASVQSYWSSGDPLLRGDDGRAALVVVGLPGDEDRVQRTAERVVPELTGVVGPFRVAATGEALANAEAQKQGDDDLVVAELVSAPLILLILLVVFRSFVAALVPLVLGAVGIVLTLVVLRVTTEFAPVSVFALNLTTALGLGLAVDYSLLIISRFREERAAGADPVEAVTGTLGTAGRTVLFSSVTVALCLSALLVFPMYFLRSLAYAAIPTVLGVGVGAVVLLPPLLLVVGRLLDASALDRFLGRILPRSRGRFWFDLAGRVVRRPLLWALPVLVLLLALGAPFLGARFGLTDERVLPLSAQSHSTANEIDRNFDAAGLDPIDVLVPSGDPRTADRSAAAISRLNGVSHVDGPSGRFVDGDRRAPNPGPAEAYVRADTSRLSVVTTEPAYSAASSRVVDEIRDLDLPVAVGLAGNAVLFNDTSAAVADRLPLALALMGAAMFVLLFLFSGGLLVPVKAIVFNSFSVLASFGAMVYVFQEGHLTWLVGDFVATGYLDVTIPVLMFCIAFGLSMDYEIFLISRIREEFVRSGDNTRAIIEGIGRTGPIISAAAVLIGVVLLALVTSQVSILKMLGVGLFLAVLVDALVVRGVLVPAFMQVAGKLNWWAPAPLRRLHQICGLAETSSKSPGTSPETVGDHGVEQYHSVRHRGR